MVKPNRAHRLIWIYVILVMVCLPVFDLQANFTRTLPIIESKTDWSQTQQSSAPISSKPVDEPINIPCIFILPWINSCLNQQSAPFLVGLHFFFSRTLQMQYVMKRSLHRDQKAKQQQQKPSRWQKWLQTTAFLPWPVRKSASFLVFYPWRQRPLGDVKMKRGKRAHNAVICCCLKKN